MRHFSSTAVRAGAVIIATISLSSPANASKDNMLGNWARGDGDARVRIAPCGDALCATNTWIRDESSSGEHVGDRLVMKVSGDGGSLSGTAYDPQRKLSYSLEINVGAQSMRTRGCVLAGIVCKSVEWTRVSR